MVLPYFPIVSTVIVLHAAASAAVPIPLKGLLCCGDGGTPFASAPGSPQPERSLRSIDNADGHPAPPAVPPSETKTPEAKPSFLQRVYGKAKHEVSTYPTAITLGSLSLAVGLASVSHAYHPWLKRRDVDEPADSLYGRENPLDELD